MASHAGSVGPGGGGDMGARELCVIFNPAAGKRRAHRRLEALRRSWADRAVFWPTEEPGHAEELARRATLEGFARIAAAGGDGTLHEVANGMMRAGPGDSRLVVVPIGSANDFAYSLFRLIDRPAVRIDVGRARRGDGRERFFLCNLGIGFNGAVTLESRRITWLQGMALYGLAALRALGRHFAAPMMDISIDDEPMWRVPTLLIAVLLGLREGGFVLAPQARLDDGLFDLVHAGPLSRWEVLRLLPRLALSGPPVGHPQVRQTQCRKIDVHSETPVNVHVDGEFLCTADEGFRDVAIELLPAALAVDVELSRTLSGG